MSGAMPEPRTAVKILVEASWKDEKGALQTVPAWMENKSAGGACIRLKTQIGVGSNLSIQGRWEQISGTAKYCCSSGKAYLVGIQRDTTKVSIVSRPVATCALSPEVQSKAEPQENQPKKVSLSDPKVENVPIVHIPSLATPMTLHQEKPETDWDRPRIPRPQDTAAIRQTDLQLNLPPRAQEAGKERKPMQRKWSELMHRHDKQDEANGNTNGKDEAENRAPHARATEESSADPVREGVAGFPVELVRVEDIYRTAGIMNPRSGYSIGKVIEMLHSAHTRDLSKEAKRAAVLMALDAAGVPIDEVLKDAKAREDALNSYEAEQRKEVEAEWERKAEENVQIEAELERVKAQYMARIGRNLAGVAREKAAFNSWLTMKQQESQSISEAAELCVKSIVPEPAAASLPPLSMAASAKSV
jgi:hypothetical protein